MADTESRDILERGLAAMGLQVETEARERLLLYCRELCRWNEKMNLIARAPLERIWETHFLDSLTLLPLLDTSPLADIGSGAGFPGLALKIARPEMAVVLVEPRQKRVSFLNHIIRTLGLKEIEVRCGRLEKNSNLVAGSPLVAPIVTSRAFSAIPEFLLHAAPINPVGGKVLCMKGPRAAAEIAAWRLAQPESPYQLAEVRGLTLPFSGTVRNLVIFLKERNI
jgi:16S rRNA (guanine527-N7)-methyltransferase